MKKGYTVNELKTKIAAVHENTGDLISLSDYCEAFVTGYNLFKKKNGLKEQDIKFLLYQFQDIREMALNLYNQVKDELVSGGAIDGYIGEIKSEPMSSANKSIQQYLQYADDGTALLAEAKQVGKIINEKSEKILRDAKKIGDVSNNYERCVIDFVDFAISTTRKGVEGLGDVARNLVTTEEKYSDK